MKTKLVIIGVTGDLARRKLLPALEQVLRSGVVSELEIIGVSRREFSASDVLVASGCDPAVFAGRLSGFTMDLADIEDYRRLAEHLALSKDTQALLYLSVPPRAATQIVDRAGEAGLNQPNVKILFEKPFGIDLASAKEMIERTGRYFDESQIYRIDHYLAKEMAQDIIAARGGNALFARAWDNHSIERIEINATETLGVEGRGEFYEQTGALRDVVQGHLMQLLALTIMRVPEGFDWRQAPAFRAAALASLVLADPRKALWAQYEGYENDVGNPGSRVETFIQVELASRDPLWVGVPLILTTGKALPKKATEIHVYFRSLTDARSNRLTFRIQPSEGITME